MVEAGNRVTGMRHGRLLLCRPSSAKQGLAGSPRRQPSGMTGVTPKVPGVTAVSTGRYPVRDKTVANAREPQPERAEDIEETPARAGFPSRFTTRHPDATPSGAA